MDDLQPDTTSAIIDVSTMNNVYYVKNKIIIKSSIRPIIDSKNYEGKINIKCWGEAFYILFNR